MFIRKKHISRRTLLRGVGAAVALPLLDSMIPAMTAHAATVAAPQNLKRIGYVYIPMGFNPAKWIPTEDTLDNLPYSLAPLESVKDQVTVVTNICLLYTSPSPRDS